MNFQGNWIDLVIIAVIMYFVIDSWGVGLYVIIAHFLSFLLSLIISLQAYSFFSIFLKNTFTLPNSVSNAISFFLMAGLSQAFLGFVFLSLIRNIPFKYWKKSWNNIAGVIPSFGQAIVLISFLLTLIVSLPLSPLVKRDITKSKIGGFLIIKTSVFENKLNEAFGGLAEDALTYMTVKPETNAPIPINSEKGDLTVDITSENEMVKLVNMERSKVGVPELTLRSELMPIARAHAKDMWERNYFGHYSPEGKNVADRLKSAGIYYSFAGENLALAPTLQTAHTGLMNSEGHKKNILDPDFKRIGIGVIDNGIYGKMFVQIFTD